jgi:hypothetical protein
VPDACYSERRHNRASGRAVPVHAILPRPETVTIRPHDLHERQRWPPIEPNRLPEQILLPAIVDGADGEASMVIHAPVDLYEVDLVCVEPLPSHVRYQDMAEFAEGITVKRAGRRPARAIEGKAPSGNSKTSCSVCLALYPSVRYIQITVLWE